MDDIDVYMDLSSDSESVEYDLSEPVEDSYPIEDVPTIAQFDEY